jgi:hypothetical protein
MKIARDPAGNKGFSTREERSRFLKKAAQKLF